MPSQQGFFLKARCTECGETFNLFINTATDFLQDFDKDGNVTYALRKEIVGSRCRNLIQVRMALDGSKKLQSKTIENGEFIED